VALFDHAVAWLRRHRVLLPGVSVLARQVAEVRTCAEARLHRTVAGATRRADTSLPGVLIDLLDVPEGRRFSELERLRRRPTRTTGIGMAKALERVEEISAFGLRRVRLDRVPPNRLAVLARQGLGAKAPNLARTKEPKRTALVAAVVRHLEATAIDDALDVFALLMAVKLINPARRATDKERLAKLPRLEKASGVLARASRVLFAQLELLEQQDAAVDVPALWQVVETVASRETVHGALDQITELVPDDEQNAAATAMRAALVTRYNTVRPFLTLLGGSSALGAASGGRRVLAAVTKLPGLARRKVKVRPLMPGETDRTLVPPAWQLVVYANPDLPAGTVDRDAYVVCVLEQLFRALMRRDVFARPSHRWSDPRARLLDGPAWDAVREDVLVGLNLEAPITDHLAGKAAALDAAWRQLADRLAEAGPDAKVSVEVPDGGGRARLNVDKLGALGESASLRWLRTTTAAMLPQIDLPDLLFEVHAWTGFLDAFVHLGDGTIRMEDLTTSLVALLVAEACNIGYTPVVNPGSPALTRARLVHVEPVLPARRHHRCGERPADRRPGEGADRRGVGWRAAGLGRRAAVHRPQAHHQRRALTAVLPLQTGHHLAERGQRPGRRDRADSGARHSPRLPVHPGRAAEPRRRDQAGDGRHRQRLLLRHGLRDLRHPRLPVLPAVQGPGRPAAVAAPAARGSARRVRPAGTAGPQQGQPREDHHVVAGDAAGGRLPGHQPGPRV
jgi:hypothetical protein